MTNEEKTGADKLYQNLETKKLDNSEVEIKAELPLSVIETYRPKALKALQKTAKIDGFREGHVPEDVLVKHVGEVAILYEVAEQILGSAYPQIVLDEQIDAIGRPQIAITKIAPGNPIAFTATTAVMPVFELPDYKKLAKEAKKENPEEEIVATDEDVEEALLSVRRSKHQIENAAKNAEEGKEPEVPEDKDLPELTDEDATKLGDFKDLTDLKAKVKDNIKFEKEKAQKEKLRVAMIDKILEKTDVAIPTIFIEAEVDKMFAEFRAHIEGMGVKFDDYLVRVEKTEEELRDETRPEGEKRAKLQLVLSKIAEKETLMPDREKSDAEVKHILEHHQEADPDRVRQYVDSLLTNEAVFVFLEEQA